MTARLSRTSGNSTIGRPNASRSRANTAASRYARRITAAEPTAFSQREVLSTSPAAILKPSSSAPIGYASAPSKTISPVASARVPSLSLSLRIVKPFGSPVDRARHEEAADAARPFRRAIRPRRDGELVGVRDRAEPLLAVQPPGVAVPHRTREVRAHVRAAVLLGEELRPALTGVVVGLEQRRQEALAQLVGAVQTERADQPRRARDRARVAALSSVREQEEEPCLLERLGGEDPRRPHGSPGLRVRGMEPHVRAVGRRPMPFELVHERVDLLRDDGAETDEAPRVSEPPLEIGTPEGLHRANVRQHAAARHPRGSRVPRRPARVARGAQSRAERPRGHRGAEGLEPPDLRRGLRRADMARGVRRAGQAVLGAGDPL